MLSFLSAPTTSSGRTCSDCYEFWGRWWEPKLVAFVIAVGFLGWLAGAVAGGALRLLARRRAPELSPG